jgi:diadenosine tetraphosphate (Ap4A) HIT family hydrolase
MTILAGLRRFGLLDDESATGTAAGARQDAGPLHIHVIGAQDNKDEGATTAATFR